MNNISIRLATCCLSNTARIESSIDAETDCRIAYLAPGGRARSFSIDGALIEVAALDDRLFEFRVLVQPVPAVPAALMPAAAIKPVEAAAVAQGLHPGPRRAPAPGCSEMPPPVPPSAGRPASHPSTPAGNKTQWPHADQLRPVRSLQ